MFNNYYFIQKTYITINYKKKRNKNNKKVHFDNYVVKLYYKQPAFINNISIHEQQENIKNQNDIIFALKHSKKHPLLHLYVHNLINYIDELQTINSIYLYNINSFLQIINKINCNDVVQFNQFIYNIVSMNDISKMIYETNIFIENYEYNNDDFESETEEELQEKEAFKHAKFRL